MPRARAEEDPAAITYLKEPQWTNGFATVVGAGSRACGERSACRRSSSR